MKKLKTWQFVLLIIFYPIGIIYFIVWLMNRNKTDNSGAVRVDSSKMKIVRDLHTKVVGVTFSNSDGTSRQEIVRKCKAGDELIFKPTPSTEYPDAIGVFNSKGQQLGNVSAELAEELKYKYPTNPMRVYVESVTGGEGKNYGCNIRLTIFEM